MEEKKLEEIDQDEQKYYLPVSTYRNLYIHQQAALKWLLGLFNKKEGGLLCDEMGLGKTVSIISFLSCLHWTYSELGRQDKVQQGSLLEQFGSKNSSHLLLTPVTIMKQWKTEFANWEPFFFGKDKVWILHEDSDRKTKQKTIKKATTTRGVLIISYELARIHESIFSKHDWNYIVLDEGQKIKNPHAQVTKACQSLRGFNRIVMTGTPIQNNVGELWSLFDFACPGYLGDLQTFEKDFCGQIIKGSLSISGAEEKDAAHRCTCVLRNLITPRVLRRTRKEVFSNIDSSIVLPSKKEYVLYCSMGKEQGELYRQYINFKGLKTALSSCYNNYNKGLLVGINHLRKLANHPYILFGTEHHKFAYAKEIYGETKEYREFNEELDKELSENIEYLAHFKENPNSEKAMTVKKRIQSKLAAKHWNLSFKFTMLKKMLRGWREEGHKALIFAQTRRLLDIIEQYLVNEESDCGYLRLDGQTPVGQRMLLVNQFNTDPSINIFLLTTKVGGVGINLVGASRVLIFEPDWNPMSDAQAKDRAIRIGQLKNVVVYRLVLANCIEEKIYHRQLFKEYLARKVLKDPLLEKSFSYKDLYDFFGKWESGKVHEPGSLIQKRKVDSEKAREKASDVKKMCLKRKYADEFETEVVKAKKFKEEKETKEDTKSKKKERKGGIKQARQELLTQIFAEEEMKAGKKRNKIAEKVLSKFEKSRVKRAVALKQEIPAGFYISSLEELMPPDEAQPNEELKTLITQFITKDKQVDTEDLMNLFNKVVKQEQFLEFKGSLQNVAEFSSKTHKWVLK